LDALALGQLDPVPLAARHDLGIDGHGDTPAVAALWQLADEVRNRDALGHLALAAVHHDPHPVTCAVRAANRRGENGASSAGGSSPVRRAATASPVSGASRMPLRQWPVAQNRPGTALSPTIGPLSGATGRRPARASTSSSSEIPGR